MILVLLGTQDKPFTRLLKKVEECIDNGIIKEEVIVQAGQTKYTSDKMKIFSLIGMNELNDLIKKSNIIIAHGGVGSIIESLNNGKVVIATPRLAKYKEHVNDHQIQIIKKLSDANNIIGLLDLDEMPTALKKAKSFVPVKYKSNNKDMIKLIEELIDN